MHLSRASAANGVTGVTGVLGTMGAVAGNGSAGITTGSAAHAGGSGANGHAAADAIVLPRRGAAAPAAAASGEPRLLLLTAADFASAEAWARGLVAEGLVIECRAVAATVPAQAGPESDSRHAPDVPDAQAVVLHVADALAPHLAQLRALRARWPQLPLLAVVRGLRDLDQVLALEMGADDVLDVAVGAPVVAARLRAMWRRAAAAAGASTEREPPRELRFGALRLKRLEREVSLAEAPVPLTEGEFEVLWLLASHAGQALSRREILKRVRGLDDQPLDRSIDSRVYRIRAKLGDGQSGAARIRTVRHQGYAFSPTGW